MITSALACGGVERQMLGLTEGLLQRGYQVEVFELGGVHAGEFSFETEFSMLGVKTRRASDMAAVFSKSNWLPDVHLLGQYAELLPDYDVVALGSALDMAIREFAPETVHCWAYASNIFGGSVAVSLGVSRVLLRQVNVPPTLLDAPSVDLHRQAYRQLAKHPSVILLNSNNANRDAYAEWLALPRDAIRIQRTGFLPSSVRLRSSHERAACRRSLGVPSEALTVGAVTRFAPEKDPELWLHTAATIAAARSDVHFVLAGYGELSERIVGHIERLGLSERVVLPGPTKDVGAIYAALDVFLMTSRVEGTPNTLIEAQAAGVPVVAPNIGGIGEAFLDGTTGLLVNDRSPCSLADAVLRVLEDRRLIGAAAVEGPRFIATKFGYRRMLDEMIELYRPAAPSEWPGHETKDEVIKRGRDLEDQLRQLKRAYVNAIAKASGEFAEYRQAHTATLTKANGEFAEYRQASEAAIAKLNGEFAEYRQASEAAIAKLNGEFAEYRQASEAAIAKLNGEFAEYRQAHAAALTKANGEFAAYQQTAIAEIENLKSSLHFSRPSEGLEPSPAVDKKGASGSPI